MGKLGEISICARNVAASHAGPLALGRFSLPANISGTSGRRRFALRPSPNFAGRGRGKSQHAFKGNLSSRLLSRNALFAQPAAIRRHSSMSLSGDSRS